jgi:signal transduction histidine kinase
VPALAHVERISAAGLRMRHYIDELLKLSHLARGGLSKRTVDLSAMAGEVMAEMRVQYVERQVDASVASDMQVQAEPALLRAVLENLIGNAWKYLDPHRRGEVSVGSRTEGDVKAFFVHDNGIGFDMSFRDKLFMPFQRLHPETDIPGNGLGLAAAKRIVVRHGGRIWAEARPGYGATFYFTLP